MGNDNYKVNKFKKFCSELGYISLDDHNNPFTMSYPKQFEMLRRFIFWLQVDQKLGCDFKQARAFVAAIVRYKDLDVNPMDRMSRSYLARMQLSFDKNRIVKEKPKIAMSIKLAKHYIDKWCRKTPFDDFPIKAGAKKVDKIFLRNSLLGTALLSLVPRHF